MMQVGFGSSARGGGLTLIGYDYLLGKFARIPGKLQRKAIRRGVTKGSRLIAKAAKKYAPRRGRKDATGATKKSIGQVVRTYKRTHTVLGVIGPRKGVQYSMAVGSKSGAMRAHVPAKIAHLIEYGHAKGKGRAAAPAYPFMKPGFEQAEAAAFTALMTSLRYGLVEAATTL